MWRPFSATVIHSFKPQITSSRASPFLIESIYRKISSKTPFYFSLHQTTMDSQNTKHSASPPLAHSIIPYSGTVAAHYDCPCGRCIASPSTHTRPPDGGRLSLRNDSIPPSVPYIEDTRQDITIVPPSGPYFLNDSASFFSDDSREIEQRRGVVRSGVLHVRAIAIKARASLDSIRKRQSNGVASSDTRLPPILCSDETADEIADEDARREIQTADSEPVGLKRRITTKEKARGWVQTAKTEPMGLKCRLTAKGKIRGWSHTTETEPRGLKHKISAKEKVKGWFHKITRGQKVRILGQYDSCEGEEEDWKN